MRISDWSSDVCSSDLEIDARVARALPDLLGALVQAFDGIGAEAHEVVMQRVGALEDREDLAHLVPFVVKLLRLGGVGAGLRLGQLAPPSGIGAEIGRAHV